MGGSSATNTTTTAELVRSVFFRSRSVRLGRDGNGRSNVVEKKGWISVKSYLCGDECNSVLGDKDSASVRQLELSSVVALDNSAQATIHSQFHPDEDTASIRSSEATVTQPIAEEIPDKSYTGSISISNNEQSWRDKQNSTYRLFQQEDAAMIIQSAFRSYLARRSSQVMVGFDEGKQEHPVETVIRSPESLGSSIKVQTGDSTRTSSEDVESIDLRQPMHKRVRMQVAKLQEEWDDSTVSSTISKMRIQNRIEAATRRERALAYAFAQQLRVCAKKKRTKPTSLDTNMSRSWLERWMATRHPENSFFSNNVNKRIELHIHNQQSISGTGLVEEPVEEESCGSNEIGTQIDSDSISGCGTEDYLNAAKRKGETTNNMSRQQSVPTIQRFQEPKVNKNGYQAKDEKGNKGKPKQQQNKKEMECQDFI